MVQKQFTLKTYQKDVLADIRRYIRTLNSSKSLKDTFRNFWAQKNIKPDKDYQDIVTGVPNVTIKVPTAGGKTFIACNAIKTIFDEFGTDPFGQVVVWFVPSDTILKQTFANLTNPKHPYCIKLNTLFNNRVQVLDKETALLGTGISPTSLQEHLTIFVFSIQSFIEKVSGKHAGKSYMNDPLARRENGNLAEFVRQLEQYYNENFVGGGAEDTSLMRYLSLLHPVTIIDESHNFISDLRVDTLKELNPSFILNLTATPREISNIICYINAGRLKAEHMVKLPVILSNAKNKTNAIAMAITIQHKLEAKAKRLQENGGRYIRPIVLLQAESDTGEDRTTYDKIKQYLLDGTIPKEQIKIKTGDIDELKGIDLLNEDCPVRYIITVDALKEGWDCPFAYVLATVANRSSRVAVEQVIGRILRQPYTEEYPDEMLNQSYVVTCSDHFNDTISDVVQGLNNSGYGLKDLRVQEPADNKQSGEPVSPDLFSSDSNDNDDSKEEDNVDVNIIKEAFTATVNEDDDFDRYAQQQGEDYRKNKEKAEEQGTADDEMKNNKVYSIRDEFKEIAEKIVLPNFCGPVEVQNGGLFSEDSDIAAESQMIDLDREFLLKGFNLANKDKDIKFIFNMEAKAIDVENVGADTKMVQSNLNDRQQRIMLSIMDRGDRDVKLDTVVGAVLKQLKKDNELNERDLKRYITDVLSNKSNDDLRDLMVMLPLVIEKFKLKIKHLKNEYASEQFRIKVDSVISTRPQYHFPAAITVNQSADYPKGLYVNEDGYKLDTLEQSVLSLISNMDNVLFWHRNPGFGPMGFRIFGYIRNHYPDFIVVTKKGNIILVETKGQHLDGSDSKYKIEIGREWEKKAGSNFHYFMVFKDNEKDPLEGAMNVTGLLERLRDM